MEDITQNDGSPETKGELTSPLSPKRARTDCAVTDNLTGSSRFESVGPLISQQTISFPSSRELPETEGLTSTAGCGNFEDGKPPAQSQFTPLTYTATLNSSSAHAGPPEVCFISTEKHLILLKRDEQPPVTEADQLSLYLTDGTGGSPPPASANTPGLSDCEQLGKSPKDEAADSCSLSVENEEDEEVRCQSDCTSKEAVHGTGLCNTQSQFAEVLVTNQRREELDLSTAEGESPISSRDYAEFKPLHSKPEEDPSGNLAESGKNEKNKLEPQTRKNENVFICHKETKGEVNENKTFIPFAAECDEGSALYDVDLGGNIAAEKVSLEVNNHSGADQEEPVEGDNDEDPFSEIDPAIRSEAAEEAEGACCSSGKETACEMETASVSSADQADQQIREPPHGAKNEVHCQPHAESQTSSVNNNETCNITGDEGSCQWKSSPLKPPPAGDSHDTEGHQLKEQSQTSCFPDSTDHMKIQVVPYPRRETDKAPAEIKEKEGGLNFLEKTESDEQGKSEEKLELKGAKDEDALTVDKSEEEIQKPTKRGDELGRLCDQVCATTEREERKEEINVTEEIKTEEKSGDNEEKQSEHKEEVSEESPGDWAKGSRLAFCSGDDQEQSLICFSDHLNRADLSVAENRDQLLAFSFPSMSDAVVPCQQDLTHSQNPHIPTALKCRYISPPSAFTFCSRVLEGFDTFEKIQLLVDDEDDDEASGLGNMPVLTSSPRQLLKTPQQQPHMLEAKSDNHMEIPGEGGDEAGQEEEEADRFECHTGNATNGFMSSDLSCYEVPNFTPAADMVALGWSEQQPTCGSACDSSENTHELKPQSVPPAAPSDGLSSDLSSCSEFEEKEQFDRVLQELGLFFEISRNDFADDCRSSAEQWSDAPPERAGSPILEHQRNRDEADEDLSVEMCGGHPGVSLTAVSSDGEQEVPLHRHPCQETSKDSAERHKGPPEQLRRLEPLKTCTRPIRVGLSRRSKTEHLHRPHPYK